mgnify:CR=1 FL=1
MGRDLLSQILATPIRAGAELPLRPMCVYGIRLRLQVEGRLRDLALFDIALNSKLSGCDVVMLRIGDLFTGAAPRSERDSPFVYGALISKCLL